MCYAKAKPTDSVSWADMLRIKQLYLQSRSMKVGNGQKTDFWGDAWCGSRPLRDAFPNLYEICVEQQISVAAMAERGWRLNIRRWLDVEL